jgi:hypothetical protein
MFVNAFASANYGIQSNLQRFESAANRLAGPVSGVREIVEIKQAEQGIKINAAVIRTASEMSDSLVDILA